MAELYNQNCMDKMVYMAEESIDFILTDIPYNCVNRSDNGLRSLNKDKADILTFNIDDFLEQCYRVAKN